jgi:RimJ/RimL family protein N-acetyltransferase
MLHIPCFQGYEQTIFTVWMNTPGNHWLKIGFKLRIMTYYIPLPYLYLMETNFILRPWTAGDIESLIENANNFKIAKFMSNQFPNPYTREHGLQFIEFAGKHNPVQIFAISVSGNAIGGIGLHPQADIMCKNMELGYWLGENYWGKGIATSAIKQMAKYAFQNFDIERVFARPFGNNPASARVLQKAGFTLEATFKNTIFKHGEYLDELIYAIRKNGPL